MPTLSIAYRDQRLVPRAPSSAFSISAIPSSGWVVGGAGLSSSILTVQGLGYLLPTNLQGLLGAAQAQPRLGAKVGAMMSRYF